MSRISGIIAFQTKKSNLEREFTQRNRHKMSDKGKSEKSSHSF